MSDASQKLIRNRKFLLMIIALSVTLLIEASFAKNNDLVNKQIIPMASKVLVFSANSSICLVLQFFIIKYVMNSFGRHGIRKSPKVASFYIISLTSFFASAFLVGLLIFQLHYYHYYEIWINILIIAVSYGTSALLLAWLSLLFLYWYKSSHNRLVFLYFISMSVIVFNMVLTGLFTSLKLNDNMYRVREYVGSSGDISGSRHLILGNVYRISSLISFFSIWVTTAIIMNSYREKLIHSVKYWILLILPLLYFLITYFYQFFLNYILISYFHNDPVSVSIFVGAFLSLSKPIGGLIFAIAFWNMSREISYERNMKMYMVIAGWGIFFIFSANQAATQIVLPYPPFGITTITLLNVASYLMILGIYNSASLVSVNNSLRTYIHKHALKLLNPIGRAEMEKEIQKSVAKISKDKEITEIYREESFEFDENELKKYLSEVIKAKKENLS